MFFFVSIFDAENVIITKFVFPAEKIDMIASSMNDKVFT